MSFKLVTRNFCKRYCSGRDIVKRWNFCSRLMWNEYTSSNLLKDFFGSENRGWYEIEYKPLMCIICKICESCTLWCTYSFDRRGQKQCRFLGRAYFNNSINRRIRPNASLASTYLKKAIIEDIKHATYFITVDIKWQVTRTSNSIVIIPIGTQDKTPCWTYLTII